MDNQRMLIFREPAPIWKDVWATQMIYEDQLMIACIHQHVETIGSENQPQWISMDITSHMELTIMQAGSEEQEQ